MQLNKTDRLVEQKERLQTYECDLVWMPHKRAQLNCDDVLHCPFNNTFLSTVKKESSLFTQYHFQKKKSAHNTTVSSQKSTAQCVSPFWCSMQGHACFQPATYLKLLSGDVSVTSSSILKRTSWSGSSTHHECTHSILLTTTTLWFCDRATMNTKTKTWYFLCQCEADNFFFSQPQETPQCCVRHSVIG